MSPALSPIPPSTDDNYAEAVDIVQAWIDAGDTDALLELSKSLDRLPPLPFTLKKLAVFGSEIDTAALPASLTFLALHNCSIDATTWPSQLRSLHIARCHSLSVPALPETLEDLSLEYIFTLTFPAALPAALQRLNIHGCPLPKLPALPASLKALQASSCGLKTLPRTFPSSIAYVALQNNKLRRLPVFPATLHTLHVHSNPLLLPQGTFWTSDAQSGMGLRIYLRDLYRIQEHPEEVPLWNDEALNEQEVADPFGEDCWEGDI